VKEAKEDDATMRKHVERGKFENGVKQENRKQGTDSLWNACLFACGTQIRE
jgi:hypothetical protein